MQSNQFKKFLMLGYKFKVCVLCPSPLMNYKDLINAEKYSLNLKKNFLLFQYLDIKPKLRGYED